MFKTCANVFRSGRWVSPLGLPFNCNRFLSLSLWLKII
jgi:hypothetical protein